MKVATLLLCSLSFASAFQVQRTPKPALDRALALRGGLSLEQTSMLGVAYLGGFGVTNLISTDIFWGSDGILPYFKSETGPGSRERCTIPLAPQRAS